MTGAVLRRRVRGQRHHRHTYEERSRPHDGCLIRKCIYCGAETAAIPGLCIR